MEDKGVGFFFVVVSFAWLLFTSRVAVPHRTLCDDEMFCNLHCPIGKLPCGAGSLNCG